MLRRELKKVFTKKLNFSWRSVVIFLIFLVMCLHAAMRNVLNVSSVCMLRRETREFRANNSSLAQSNRTRGSNFSAKNLGKNSDCRLTESEKLQYDGNLPWENRQMDFVLAAMGLGRLLAIFPAGYLADKYNSSNLLLWSTLLSALCSIFTPLLAQWGFQCVMALRFLLGLLEGFVQPAMTALIGQWCPESELSSRLIFTMSGLQLTVFILNPSVAFYCSALKHLWGGWPVGFLSSGALSLVWCGAWYFLATNYPEQHKRISRAELDFIAKNRRFTMQEKCEPIRIKDYPWKSIFFSKASIACLICDTAGTFGVFVVLYYFPRYLRDVIVLNINLNGLLAGLPNLCMFFCKLIFSCLADFMKNTMKWDKTWVVRGFNTVGLLSLACFLLGATYVTCHQPALAVLCVVLSKALYAAAGPGFIASELLIAPRYAGVLSGWYNAVASTSQLLVPYLVASIVRNSHSAEQWRVVFALGSAAQIAGAGVFLLWGSGEEQPWAVAQSSKATEDLNKAETETPTVSSRTSL